MKKRSKVRPYYLREVDEGSMLAVMGSGRVSFEVPRGWAHRVDVTGIKLFDRDPPENDCVFEASMLQHPAGPMRELPVWKMLQDSHRHHGRDVPREEIVEESRGEIEIAWIQYSEIHPKHTRVAVFCNGLIRGSGFHVLLSYAYWPEEAARLSPVWSRAIETFEIGRPDPQPN